jgi:hypothetical protein
MVSEWAAIRLGVQAGMKRWPMVDQEPGRVPGIALGALGLPEAMFEKRKGHVPEIDRFRNPCGLCNRFIARLNPGNHGLALQFGMHWQMLAFEMLFDIG